ncbi:NADP-dependent oxidoreductase [Streptomyces griseoviridis]|uniref:NADP-dependent oxidoreductase n=1 Tax=Streptomyces griseoviridis TaxID=45398 RepID=A0A3S9ZMI3_STRGD|nr:NADP-dependent oxidoreductase [Streptomyces griseoviridis]AZS89090.1 NADP-dependent oxidoreductase [Streptomyces griseoviridis]QCN84061.1 NADPH:quinone reductase [Streptomyces griseoviridis]
MPEAYVFTRYGGPETEALVEVERPVPGPGQVLVAVRAAGVNPVDWKQRTGYRRPGETGEGVFPAVFGNEVSGVVEETGEGVTEPAVGDAVFGRPVEGGYSTYALLSTDLIAAKPDGLSFTDAATLPVAGVTAYDGVRQIGLSPGDTLLVTGAGGGVGVAAVQIARSFGLRVLGLASEGKRDLVESLGATHVPSGDGWTTRVPGTVDGVYDLVGGDVLAEAATLLTDRTRLVTAGAPPAEVERLGGARVVRDRTSAQLAAVAALVVSGDLDPHVTDTFPLERADEALRTVEEGHARGKIVIEVAG